MFRISLRLYQTLASILVFLSYTYFSNTCYIFLHIALLFSLLLATRNSECLAPLSSTNLWNLLLVDCDVTRYILLLVSYYLIHILFLFLIKPCLSCFKVRTIKKKELSINEVDILEKIKNKKNSTFNKVYSLLFSLTSYQSSCLPKLFVFLILVFTISFILKSNLNRYSVLQ